MKDSTIKTMVSLIFTNNARNCLNYPYSNLYTLGIRDFTIAELKKFGADLTTKEFSTKSCFSNIDFSSTTRIEYSTNKQEPIEKSEVFLYVTQKDQKQFKCRATSVDDCVYKIKKGLCPRKHVHWKFFETFQQQERD